MRRYPSSCGPGSRRGSRRSRPAASRSGRRQPGNPSFRLPFSPPARRYSPAGVFLIPCRYTPVTNAGYVSGPMTALPIEPVATAAQEPRWRLRRGVNVGDRVYRAVLTVLAVTLPLLLLALVGELLVSAWPAIRRFGPHFLWSSVWDPVAGVFGAAPMIFGTLASSLLALVIAVPLALGVSIFLTEFAPKWVRQPIAFLVELLAAIP